MTRNLYVGGDLVPPAAATDLAGLAAGVDGFLDAVRATRFDVRARLLAAEIAASRADVVAVQEAALWRAGSSTGPAEAVTADHLALLLDALSAAGAPFEVAASGEAADLTVPTPDGPVRLTLRDVVLVRRDADVEVLGSSSGRFAARLEREVGGTRFAVDRGWARADLRTPLGEVAVVGTHLDSIDAGAAAAQAGELLDVLGEGPVVVLLDANSGPPPADPGPWRRLVDGGLTDAWAAARPDETGHTFGLSETVDDRDWSGLVSRLDHVLVRGVDVADAAVTGTTDRDAATGLWASDHAGVVATLVARG